MNRIPTLIALIVVPGVVAVSGCDGGNAPVAPGRNDRDVQADSVRYFTDDEVVAAAAQGRFDFDRRLVHCEFCEVVVTEDDRCATPGTKGIVWHGVWEDAVAEVRRTGRPLLLHFGSPRVMEVCGAW